MERPINVHVADEANAFFGLVIQFEYEAKYVAGIDETDEDGVSRGGNLVVENHHDDAGLDKLAHGSFYGTARQLRLPGGTGKGPELPVVVLQYLHLDQAPQRQIDYILRLRAQTLDPVLGATPFRLSRNLPERRVQDWIARFRLVHEEQRLHVRVDAGQEGKFRQHRPGKGAVEIPAGHLVKIAVLLIEEYEEELFGHGQRFGRHAGIGLLGPGPATRHGASTPSHRRLALAHGWQAHAGRDPISATAIWWARARGRPDR